MITYLEKYNQLPEEARQAMSAPAVIGAIEELEKEYGVSLAAVVMRTMVRDISIVDLPQFFAFEYDLEPRQAEKLTDALRDRVFRNVGAYLGISIDPAAKPESAFASAAPAAEPPVRGSNFFFSTEDEEEVKELAKTLKIQESENEAAKMLAEERAGQAVDKVVDRTRFNFSSEELHQRFRKIIYTYVKGVRNRIDTKQTMLKEVKTGGLGLNELLANKALKIADEVKDAEASPLPAPSGPSPAEYAKPERAKQRPLSAFGQADGSVARKKEPALDGLRDAPYDFQALPADKETPSAPPPAKLSFRDPDSVMDKPAVPPRPASAAPGLKIDLSVPLPRPFAPPPPPAAPVAPAAPDAPLIVNRPQVSARPRLEDVKKVPKLSGPIDELKDFGLVDFRRLSGDPAKAAAKIKEKLRFLEEDAYDKKLMGIRAWRQSAVNRQYLDIGEASIAAGRSIEETIADYRRKNEDVLSYSEFLAIMDLNRSIRF